MKFKLNNKGILKSGLFSDAECDNSNIYDSQRDEWIQGTKSLIVKKSYAQ